MQWIEVHLIYDVNHDGTHKEIHFVEGNLTDISVDSVYSGVVSLKGLSILIFLAELNDLDTWVNDIGKANGDADTLRRWAIII